MNRLAVLTSFAVLSLSLAACLGDDPGTHAPTGLPGKPASQDLTPPIDESISPGEPAGTRVAPLRDGVLSDWAETIKAPLGTPGACDGCEITVLHTMTRETRAEEVSAYDGAGVVLCQIHYVNGAAIDDTCGWTRR